MILPVRKETLVLQDTPEEAIDKIRYVTGKRTGGKFQERPVKFVGQVGKSSFNITRFLNRPENFMPMIQGSIEPVARGSILSLKYTLQFSSRMFVIFWTVTALLFAVFLWFIQSNWKLGLFALGFLVLNMVITHVNFQRQFVRSREILMEVLEA